MDGRAPPTFSGTKSCERGVNYLLTGLNVHSNLLQVIKDGGKWGVVHYLLATLSPTEWLCMNLG